MLRSPPDLFSHLTLGLSPRPDIVRAFPRKPDKPQRKGCRDTSTKDFSQKKSLSDHCIEKPTVAKAKDHQHLRKITNMKIRAQNKQINKKQNKQKTWKTEAIKEREKCQKQKLSSTILRD